MPQENRVIALSASSSDSGLGNNFKYLIQLLFFIYIHMASGFAIFLLEAFLNSLNKYDNYMKHHKRKQTNEAATLS